MATNIHEQATQAVQTFEIVKQEDHTQGAG